MTKEEVLLKCLDKYRKNRAYNAKPGKTAPQYVDIDTALKDFKFFFVGSKHFLPALIVDIDSLPKKEILKKVEYFPLTPTFIVETDKGYHLWWVLKYPIKPFSKQHNFYKYILNLLVDAFEGDKHAKMMNSGHIYRNPLKAKNHIFTPIEYTLKDFYTIFKQSGVMFDKELEFDSANDSKEYTGKYINLSKVEVGARNASITHNIGVYLRNRFKKSGNISYAKTLKWAMLQNNTFPEPLEESEIISTVSSMVSNFDESAKATEYRVKFNQKLARNQKLQTMKKAAKNIVINFAHTIYLPFMMPHNLNKLSDREFQNVAGIGKNTANRYKKDLKTLEDLYILIQAELRELVKLLKESKCCVDNSIVEAKTLKLCCQKFKLSVVAEATSPP